MLAAKLLGMGLGMEVDEWWMDGKRGDRDGDRNPGTRDGDEVDGWHDMLYCVISKEQIFMC
jgi:hypothetical protein